MGKISLLVGVGTLAAGVAWLRVWRRCRRRPWIDTADAVRVCSAYGIDESSGFAPPQCLARLPPAFSAWEDIAAELPALNRSGALRAAVDGMPLLDASNLRGVAEQDLHREW
ncbi:hypothetical protein T484DRAFT_1906393 [Baffinella frigidus]|nr:hypothetical protein T484DRAFT_1906393 [Cryptophyta sp. CCMP2293]